ncbi:putative phosphoserine phosphatase 2 [subsurface metagenome]|jgi:broad specificity phosphatase PhoE
MTIFLIRHGETEYNKKGVLMGELDIPLNDEGKRQAIKIAERLASIKVSHIYSSDRSRALQTAEIISDKLKIPVIESKDLQEHLLGKLEGRKWNPEWLKDGFEGFEKVLLREGGESVIAFEDRVWKCFNEIIAQNDVNNNIVIISHGAAIKIIFKNILQSSLKALLRIRQDNGCINIINVKNTGKKPEFEIQTINDCNHLEENIKDKT